MLKLKTLSGFYDLFLKYILATVICRVQFLNYLLLDNFLVHF